MTNFDAIVLKGQELLDAIKGGAIRTMENSFNAFMVTVNSEWAAKKAQVDNEAIAAVQRVNTDTVIADMGFTALNYNEDYKDTKTVVRSGGGDNVWPIGVSWNSHYNFNDLFKAEVIKVNHMQEPATRPEVIKELLDVMGIGRNQQHFYDNGFQVLKLTVEKLPVMIEGQAVWMHVTGDYHLAYRGGVTAMHYLRSPATANVWKHTVAFRSGASVGNGNNYWHYDAIPLDGAAIGDEIYIALPTVCAGRWPTGLKHSQLTNLRNKQVRSDNDIMTRTGI